MSYLSSQSFTGSLLPNKIFRGTIYKIPDGYLSVIISIKLSEEGYLRVYSSNDGKSFSPFDQTLIQAPFQTVQYPLRGLYFYIEYENFVVSDAVQILTRISESLPLQSFNGNLETDSVMYAENPDGANQKLKVDSSGNLLVAGISGGGVSSDVTVLNFPTDYATELTQQDININLANFTDNVTFNVNKAMWVAIDNIPDVQVVDVSGVVDISGVVSVSNQISGYSLETTQQEILNTVSHPPTATLILDSPEGISAYADTNPAPTVDLYKRKGWYYTNTSAGNKYNYYFYSNGNTTQTLADITGAWCVCENDSTTTTSSIVCPIISVYTLGNLNLWYQSSRAYTANVNMVAGMKYLFYWGVEPTVYPELPRVQLTLARSNGPQLPSETVLTMSVGSDSSASAGIVKNLMSHVAWRNSSNEFITELIGDSDYISTDVRILNKLTTGIVTDISGQRVDISGQRVVTDISGQTVKTDISGQRVDISGQTVITDISGQRVDISGQTVITDISGQRVDISGQTVKTDISGQTVKTDISGQRVDISGQTVKTDISGQTVKTDISGQRVDISGQTVITDISGQRVDISGQTVITDISGQRVDISGQTVITDISGQRVDISGQTVKTDISGQTVKTDISGQTVVTDISGQRVDISGQRVITDISGQTVQVNTISGFATQNTLSAIDMTLSSGSLITQSTVQNKANNNLRTDLYADNGTAQEKLTSISGKLQVHNMDVKLSEVKSGITTTNEYLYRNTYDASGNLKTFIQNSSLDCHIYGSSDGSAWHHIKTNPTGVVSTNAILETDANGALTSTVSSGSYNALDVSIKNSSLGVKSLGTGSWGNAVNNGSLVGSQYTSGIDISSSAYIYVIYRDGNTGVFDSILVEWSFDNTNWYYLGDSIFPSTPQGQQYRQGTLNDKRKYGWNYIRFKNNGNSQLSSIYITILGSSI